MKIKPLDWMAGVLLVSGVISGVAAGAEGQIADSAGGRVTPDEFCSDHPRPVSPAPLSLPRSMATHALQGFSLHNDEGTIELSALGKHLTSSEYGLRNSPHPVGVEITFRFGGTEASRRPPFGRGTRSKPRRRNPEFWQNRQYFFHEGTEITLGPPFRKYGAPDAFETATQRQGSLLWGFCPKMALALATTDCGATQSC